jgi:hypothetical protein
MNDIMNQSPARHLTKSGFSGTWLLATCALILGATCGLIYGRQTLERVEQNGNLPLNEIIVSKSRGLLFKSDDGTPLVRISQDAWGTHLTLLSSEGNGLVELNNLQGTGAVIVGSKAGGFAYMQAQENAATITLIGKHGKEAVEMTSATADGSGHLSINEGTSGYKAVEIGGGPNRVKSKGTITIANNRGATWQAP